MRRSLKKKLSLAGGLSAALALIAFAGCTQSTVVGSDPLPQDSASVTAVLTNVGANVIYATYIDLDAKAAALQQAIDTLNAHPTDSNLALAKQAWRNIRQADEADEGFLFGPVENLGVDAGTDSWPLDVTALNGVLSSNGALTKEVMDIASPNIKGFHTIEYLLWGENGAKTAASLTSRELQYLEATTQSLKGLTDALSLAWNPAGGNFLGTFESAGQGSNQYHSQSGAVEDLLDGIIGICDEVSNSKIYGAFSEQDDTLEESRFSDNSNADFANNIRSVQNVYLGTYVGQGNGLGLKSLILAQKDTVLAAKIDVQTDSAISAIGQMTPTFHLAIFNNKAKVQAAINAVQALKKTLSSQQLRNDLGLQ